MCARDRDRWRARPRWPEEDTLGATGRRLRQQTAAVHERVEVAVDLLDPGLTPARLTRVVERFYGFWSGTEAVIDTWADSHPDEAAALDWTRRRRQEHLHHDLLALGADPDAVPIAAPVVPAAGDAAVFGWLYVAEGSTLGGAVLDRRLRELTDGLGLTLRSFVPYAEGPGPMWQAYHRVLDAWVGDDERRADAVVAAASLTFESLEAWLTPLRDEVAA